MGPFSIAVQEEAVETRVEAAEHSRANSCELEAAEAAAVVLRSGCTAVVGHAPGSLRLAIRCSCVRLVVVKVASQQEAVGNLNLEETDLAAAAVVVEAY